MQDFVAPVINSAQLLASTKRQPNTVNAKSVTQTSIRRILSVV